MSIDYYLAGRRHKRIFDIGDHKCSLHLYELCQQAAGDEKLRPKERFVATCVERFLALFREHQDWFDPGEGAQERWVKWAKKCAAAVVDFCEAEGWDVLVVNDCDDSLFDHAADHGTPWPTTHSIYEKDNEGDPTCRIREDLRTTRGHA